MFKIPPFDDLSKIDRYKVVSSLSFIVSKKHVNQAELMTAKVIRMYITGMY